MQSTCPAAVPELPRWEKAVAPPPPLAPPVAPPRVAVQLRRSVLRPFSFPVAAFVAVSLLVVLFLLQFARLVQIQYDLIAKKETMNQLLQEKAELDLSIQQLSALNRVEGEARRLGMIQPETWQVLDLVHLARQDLDGKVASAGGPPVGR